MSIKFTIPNVPTAVDYTATSVSNNGATIPVINKPTLFSGAYTDLTGKPTLATVATSGAYTDLTAKPTFATVATSGKYDDLTGNVTATNVTTAGTLAVTGSITSLPVNAMTSNTSSDGFVVTSNTSQSGAANVNAYQAFDRNTATAWIGAQNYFPQNGIYAASATTTVGGTSIPGDWIQLQTPVPYRLTSYVMTDTAARQKQWTLAGSLDGTTWSLIDSQNLTTIPTSATTYTPAVTTGVFTYFRLIVQLTLGAVTNGTPTNLAELLFNGVPVLIASGQNGVITQEITKTNALAATWYTTSNVTLTAGNNVTFGNWALQGFSKVPAGLTLLNGSNQLVFPYNGIYSLDFTANLSAVAANEFSMWFQSVSGTYGTTSRRLGSYDQASGTVNAHCSYLGYFAAGDVMIAGAYAQSANTSGGILSMVLIARTP
jgi:hypothetical protein